MASFGNPDTQREQAVYQVMGIPLGRGGLDGIRGPATTGARKLFAERLGIDPKDERKVKEALDEKIKDPATRDNFLRLISLTAPEKLNPNDAKAAQWLLKEGGRDMSRSMDPLTGMMDGKVREDTLAAMAENRRRLPTEAEVNKYTGENARFINDLVSTRGWGSGAIARNTMLGNDFATAASQLVTPATTPVLKVEPKVEQKEKVALGLPVVEH